MDVAASIFRQYDIRGVVGEELTTQAAYAIGRAYARHCERRRIRGAIAVGRDNRPTGESLRDALIGGLTTSGVDVIDIGVVPTPLLYWSLHHLPVAGGIQITGSHNPPEYNGFKLCIGRDSLHGDGIQSLRDIIVRDDFARGAGEVDVRSVIEPYLDDMVARLEPATPDGARPLRVVVDCGNGAGSLVAPALFRRLGIDVSCLYCESDGTFPNHHPDPTVVENLRDLIAQVVRERADLGVAFDGDADRIGVVDSAGRIIWGDHLLILYARDVLARTGAGQSIVFDVKCSQALPHAISAAGGVPLMWKTGHSLIKEKMKDVHAPVAGEMSGHMFFAEGFYGHDDALYAAARLCRIVAYARRPVHELLADVPPYVATPEIRIDCPDDRKFAIVAAAIAHFRRSHDVIDVDGARVLFGDGWGLLRASNTQPALVARYEATTPERLAAIRETIERWLHTQGAPI